MSAEFPTVEDLRNECIEMEGLWERALERAVLAERRLSKERERIADYLLTYGADGDATDPWQAGHNHAMREASRMVREGWTDLPTALTGASP